MPNPGQTIATIEKTSADPAAAAEITFTADEDMIVYSLAFALVTDGTGTPHVHLVADDGADIFFRSPAAAAQATSVTNTYTAFAGSKREALVDTVAVLAFPTNGLMLRKGDRLRTVTTTLAGTDNYGIMTIQAEVLP